MPNGISRPLALFINGVFEKTFEEILSTQDANDGIVCYLQPYKNQRIRFLAEQIPSAARPVTLYASVSHNLNQIAYRAEIVSWEDKVELSAARRATLNEHMREFQPGEGGIYRLEGETKPAVNLIGIRNLQALKQPFHRSCLIKRSDGMPLRSRSQAGGWSVVYEGENWLGMLDASVSQHDLLTQREQAVRWSLAQSAEQRQQRLREAPVRPEKVQQLSMAFRRNPDVIAEVLLRADGSCEECGNPAPFHRASDGSPFLEVHHRKTLAEGGDDTVDNAIAVCPNCHRKLHFG